jgi:hypothetical protein
MRFFPWRPAEANEGAAIARFVSIGKECFSLDARR